MARVEDKPDVRNEVKQVILIRRDLGMRRGKEIAQGSHASIAFITNAVSHLHAERDLYFEPDETLGLSDAAWEWLDGSFTKVTLQVHSEEELLKYHQAALDAGIISHVIKDSGRTEFNGVPTYTTCAIGPDYAEKIDEVTRELRLY